MENVIREVNEVVNGVERVREALQNPMQTIGSLFGSQLDAKLEALIGNRLGVPEEQQRRCSHNSPQRKQGIERE